MEPKFLPTWYSIKYWANKSGLLISCLWFHKETLACKQNRAEKNVENHVFFGAKRSFLRIIRSIALKFEEFLLKGLDEDSRNQVVFSIVSKVARHIVLFLLSQTLTPCGKK